MPTVYTTQDTPHLDLSAALQFGDIKPLLPDGDLNFSLDDCQERVDQALGQFDPDNDYLLLVGNPMGIAMAMLTLARLVNHGPINILKWNRRSSTYLPLKFTMETLYDH